MNLRRKFAVMLSVLVLSLGLAPAASAATYTSCTTAPSSPYTPTWHVIRSSSTYYAAKAQFVIRQLHGCTNAAGGEDPIVLVMAANLEDPNDFPQIGYGTFDTGGTNMRFWASMRSGGSADVSVLDSGNVLPIVGNTIRFLIYRVSVNGVWYWEMRVEDVTRGAGIYWSYRRIAATDAYTHKVWYGIEQHNNGSQFGTNSSTTPLQVRFLNYKLGFNAAWTVLTGTTGYAWANLNGPIPACWQYSITTYDGSIATNQTSLNGYTKSTC